MGLIRFLLLGFFLSGISLQGLEFVFVPDHEPAVHTLFSKEEVIDYHNASIWNKIKYLLNQSGHSVRVASFKEIPLSSITKNTRLVLWNLPDQSQESKFKKIKSKNLILLVFEPPSVLPKLHKSAYLNHFSKVLTWEDDRIDRLKFFKYHHPVCYPMIKDRPLFKEKTFCAIMAANKKSKFIGEIYTERRKAIQYFNQFPDQFDLYGPGWENEGFISYKGKVENKISALKNYKFSICYENTVGMRGYITEKIFDCFNAGVVPVYLGAPNISEDVPLDCFIDKRNFATYEELHKYLLSISEEEYNAYLIRIQEFLDSEAAQKYTPTGFADSIVNGLLH